MMRTTLLLATLSTGCLVGEFQSADPSSPTDPSTEITPTEPGNPTGPLPPGKAVFILAHGFSGTRDSFDPAIVAAIQADGNAVFRTQVPGVESVAVQAAALGPEIDSVLQQTGATKVHIIAHSMGGLDARYLITKLGYADKVASLTTMSTPHRGTPLADLALGLTTSASVSQSDALDAITMITGSGVDPAALDRALVDLSETQAATFNAAIVDAPGVTYASYGGLATIGALSNPNAATACASPVTPTPDPDSTRASLVLAAPIVANGTERKPNDGVVGVESAKWGTFAGCVPADHLDLTSTQGSSLDTPTFYRALAAKLVQ